MSKPYLILSSLFWPDSRVLRQTAINLGWKTLRLEKSRLPEWFEEKSAQYALFYTAPQAFNVAKLLSIVLLGCDAYWLSSLPQEFVKREIAISLLKQAFKISQTRFVKPALSKSFRAGIYNQDSLRCVTRDLPDDLLVCIAEPVVWLAEYRCFVLEKQVATISPYLRNGKIFLDASHPEINEAKAFASSVLECSAVATPPAFVMDVGIIENRGWAVIESNECWAAGIYGCDPTQVLNVLLKACVPRKNMNEKNECWDFERHFLAACPQYR